MNCLEKYLKRASLSPIVLKLSLGIRVRYSSLFAYNISVNSLFNCAKTSNGRRYIKSFVQYFLCTWRLRSSAKSIIVRSNQSPAAKLVFVCCRVKTIYFITQTNLVSAAEFFLKQTTFSLILFLLLSAAITWKNNGCCVDRKINLTNFLPKEAHSFLIVGRIHSYKSWLASVR